MQRTIRCAQFGQSASLGHIAKKELCKPALLCLSRCQIADTTEGAQPLVPVGITGPAEEALRLQVYRNNPLVSQRIILSWRTGGWALLDDLQTAGMTSAAWLSPSVMRMSLRLGRFAPPVWLTA